MAPSITQDGRFQQDSVAVSMTTLENAGEEVL